MSSMQSIATLTAYSRLPERLERSFPEAAAAQPYDKYGNAERLAAMIETLAGRKLGHVVDLGGNAGYFCLSLIDAGLAESATVYDMSVKALDAGRAMARHMGLSKRVAYVEQPLDLAFVRALPKTDTVLCLNLLHHAGQKFDPDLIVRDGWEAYAQDWLSALRDKADLAIIGLGFELKKPARWDAAYGERPARFAGIVAKAGWNILYDANVHDIQRLGVAGADGRYTLGGARHKPLPNSSRLRQIGAIVGRKAGNRLLLDTFASKRRKYHLYILDRAELVIVAGVSGAGKTAFISRLKAGDVPKGLVLPNGALAWPIVKTSRTPVWPRGAAGVILDYDMNGRRIGDGAAYADDPALGFLARARSVTVINVRPPLDTIRTQVQDRAALLPTATGIWRVATPAFRWAERALSKRIVKAVRRRTPFCHEKKIQSAARKLDLYERDWLDGLYGRWAAHLKEVEESGTPIRQVSITPTDVPFRWRLMAEEGRR